MSWWITLTVEVDGNEVELYDRNYTHNCNQMIRDAGLPEWWDGVNGWKASELAVKLSSVIDTLRQNRAEFKAMDPPNGWGDYESLIVVLGDIRDKCDQFPSAVVRVSG